MLFLALSFFAPMLAVFLMISYLLPDFRHRILLKLSLSVGLAFGLTSCTFFIWLNLFGPPETPYLIAETSLLLITALIFGYAGRHKTDIAREDAVPLADRNTYYVLLATFGFTTVSTIIMFVAKYLYLPHGAWDAWTIWNQRARFIFRGWERWSELFSHYKDYPHLDYPLMLSGTIARAWSYLGQEVLFVPAIIAFIFSFATVALIWSSITHLKTRYQGILAAVTLMAVPYYIAQSAWQYADVPMGCLMLSTFVLFALQDIDSEGNHAYAALAGTITGLGAWLKNEGLLILLCMILARAAAVISTKGWKAYLTEFSSFMKGLLPIVAVIVYFKLRFAPPNDLVSGQGAATFKRLTDISRYMVTAEYYIRYFFNVVRLPAIIFPAALFLLGLSKEKRYKTTVMTACFAIALILSGYYMVYITTPKNIVLHIETSYKRLLLHLLPGGIFAFFLALASPEERKQLSETVNCDSRI